MELKEALESIVADMDTIGRESSYILTNFLTPISYIDQASSYQQRDLPLARELAEDLFLESFREIALVDEQHQNLNFLVKQLSWYERCQLRGDNLDDTFPYHDIGIKIIDRYDSLASPAEKALVEHYFADTIATIRTKVESLD